MTRTIKSLLAPALAVASLLVASNALAVECKADADCGPDAKCEKSVSVAGCNQDTMDCSKPPEPVVSETGFCIDVPRPCTTDADCGQPYLKCIETPAPGVACGGSTRPDDGTGTGTGAGGSVDCPQPAPSEPTKTCGFMPIECTDDAGCPNDWACSASLGGTGVACPAIACAPGSECPLPPECQNPAPVESKKACEPKKIDCADDAACPSGWSCEVIESSGCASTGGGVTPAPDGGTEPVPGTKPAPASPEPDCTPTEVKACVPPGIRGSASGVDYGAPLGAAESSGSPTSQAGGVGKGTGGTTGSGSNGASGSGGGSTAAAPAAGSGDSDDGGCSVRTGPASAWPVTFALAGLLARLARRRRG